MSFTAREFWGVIHGMGLGAVFLVAFAGGLAGLWSLRPEWITAAGLQERIRRLIVGTSLMAVVAWLTVLTGTYIVYPWYRAKPPEGIADVSSFPRSFLLAHPNLANWHNIGMEWKEHIGWFAPILSTAVAFVVFYYGPKLASEAKIRRAVTVLFVLAFLAATVAGGFGAFVTKAAPVH